jgi:N-acetylglucosaminyl-diphospho-decaprenol L-rhamnosyltransferase
MRLDKKVSAIVVNYNRRDLLHDCLSSLLTPRDGYLTEVIVVDNASCDGSADFVRTRFPQVRLFANKENEGYAKACNKGIRSSCGDYILILNGDIIVQKGAIEHLVEFIRSRDNAGAVSGRLLNPDGSIQREYLGAKFPGLRQVFHFFAHGRTYMAYDHIDFNAVCKVDQPPGACVMVKRSVIDKVGLMDERFFLWYEDVDWCLRIRKAGFDNYYFPGADFIHVGGASFDIEKKELKERYLKESLEYYIDKHFSRYSISLLRFLARVRLPQQKRE